MLKESYEQFVGDGFDRLGALVMVIDGYPADSRYRPTIDLLEAIGYQPHDSIDVGDDEYLIQSAGGRGNEAALRAFFVVFKMGKFLIRYQPLNRCILRGKSCKPHRPESDFRFADWYPAKNVDACDRVGSVEDQLADFPNAMQAAQFLHHHGYARSNTHVKLNKNTYFVSCRQGDGQPSGIVFRGDDEAYFYDYYSDERFLVGQSGLLMEWRQTERQITSELSLAVDSSPANNLNFGT